MCATNRSWIWAAVCGTRQSLLSGWRMELGATQAVIFSLRKLLPASLGGWCNRRVFQGRPSADADRMARQSIVARLTKAAYLAEATSPIRPETESAYLEAFAEIEAFPSTAHGDAASQSR